MLGSIYRYRLGPKCDTAGTFAGVTPLMEKMRRWEMTASWAVWPRSQSYDHSSNIHFRPETSTPCSTLARSSQGSTAE
jgi:hypothetical protein